MADARQQIRFDEPDEAYLVAAAIRQYVDGMMPADVVLVPSSHGPALEIGAGALEHPFVRWVIRRFNGRRVKV